MPEWMTLFLVLAHTLRSCGGCCLGWASSREWLIHAMPGPGVTRNRQARSVRVLPGES